MIRLNEIKFLLKGIDDIELRDGPCPHVGDCNFDEDDFCLWDNLPDLSSTGGFVAPQIEWIINNGASTAFGTGPSVDHTQGNPLGRYIYFRGDGQTQRLIGALKSPQFDAMDEDGLFCFEFWYHINDNNMFVAVPELTIAVVNNDNTNIKEVWYLERSEGDEWRLGRVPILSTEPFSVLVYGTASSDELGYAD